MPHREFEDGAGVRWQVWDTRPSAGRVVSVSPAMRNGWLSFEPVRPGQGTPSDPTAAVERLRLVPVPSNWEQLPEVRLRDLLAQARPASRPAPGGP